MDTLVAHFLIGGDEHGFMYDSTDDRPDICFLCYFSPVSLILTIYLTFHFEH